MMHVPEVGKRGCASVLCYLPRHTTTLVYRYVRPGRDSIVFMSLAGRSPPPGRGGRDGERRNSGGQRLDAGPR